MVAGSMRLVIILATVLAVAGCETQESKPQVHAGPVAPKRILVVGDITAKHPEWERLLRFYRKALIQRLKESSAFRSVRYPAPTPAPSESVILAGQIDQVDEGSEFARIMVGFLFPSAGSAVVAGRFEIRDGAGEILAEFEQEKSSRGGIDTDAHFDQVYLEDLAAEFAHDTANTVIGWARDEKSIKQPSRNAAGP